MLKPRRYKEKRTVLHSSGSAPWTGPAANAKPTIIVWMIVARIVSILPCLRGELSTLSLLNDAIPGSALALPKDARPSWATNVSWSADAFSYAGTLTDLQLHGGEDDQPLEVTDGTASFSNQDALFKTDGNLLLNGLEVPFDFDLSNRAQLPRGIENIRPHLETMDNVPLLVSLFTDCNPDNTREMLKIMQVRQTATSNFTFVSKNKRVGSFYLSIKWVLASWYV